MSKVSRPVAETGYVLAAPARQQGAGVMVIDMGTHILPKVAGAQLLVQIGVPGLEERARCSPPLRSRELTPGKPSV